MTKNYEEIKDSKVALVAHIVASLAYLAVGICLLALDAGFISNLVYSFSVLGVGILFIVFGAWYMIKYFFNHEFIKISNYGFTMGVILVIIGALFIFKANTISTFIDALVCLIGIVLGSVMLQQSFALFHIQRGTWFISLLFGVAAIGFSILFIIKPIKFFSGDLYACIYLISIGGLSLFSLILMAIGLKDHKNDVQKIYNRNMEEAPVTAKTAADDSIFEDEPEVDIPGSNTSEVSTESLFED